jgi:hypothetical protein
VHLRRAPRNVGVKPLVQLRHAISCKPPSSAGLSTTAPPRRVASTAARRIEAGKVGLSALTRIAPAWARAVRASPSQGAHRDRPRICGSSRKPEAAARAARSRFRRAYRPRSR